MKNKNERKKEKEMICVNSVEVSKTHLYLKKGQTHRLYAEVCPLSASNKKVSWFSTNPHTATVSGGLVTAVSRGFTMIVARAEDGSGKEDYCYVEISEDVLVTNICVCASIITLGVGGSTRLKETVYPSNATNPCVRWSSSDTQVATVNPTSGLVYAKKAGTATIYAEATDGSGVRASVQLTVTGTVSVNDIQITPKHLILNKGEKDDLCAKVLPDTATDKRVRWKSSNSDIVKVDAATGEVTAVSAGSVTIYATSRDGSNIQDCATVSVKEIPKKPVEDTGNTKVNESTVADPVDVYSGAHLLKQTLLQLYGGLGIKLVAEYNSTRLLAGELGIGWYHNYEKRVEVSGCEARIYSSPSSYTKYTSEDECEFVCTAANKRGYKLTVDREQTYPYVLDCNLASTEYYDSEGRLAKIVDHQGFAIQLSYTDTQTTIQDCITGKRIYLEKDSTGKVTRVYDDAQREIHFSYADELLVDICDANNGHMRYTYNGDGQVLTGTDANGVCYFTNTYDESGRVATQKDAIAGSICSTFSYETGGKRVTTDRNGKSSTRVFNKDGLLVSHTDENGNQKFYRYDARMNVDKETDANHHTIVKEYNAFNKPTKLTDKNGNITHYSYDQKGNLTQITYPEVDGIAATECFQYNNRNQLTQHTDLRGTITVYTYDADGLPQSKKVGSKNAEQYTYQNGMLTAHTDAMGYTTCYAYYTTGQLRTKTDAQGQVTTYEYDACGNLLKTIDANNKEIRNTYDGNHQKLTVTDANNHCTSYTYTGNLKQEYVTLPDGNRLHYAYDGEDREIQITDQAGHITTIQRDPCGRILAKQFPDGGVVRYEYDAIGNVTKETNPKGAETIKHYDANGKVVCVQDADGNITRYSYDACSRLVRTVNAVAGSTTYAYSSAGDLLSETDALGHKKSYTYDAFGNKTSAVDANGNRTEYSYDANNRLVTMRDALNHVTTYGYNSLNQLVSVTDAKNHTIRYGYDALGRRTTITDAKNNVFTSVYDGNGNVIKTLDANNQVVSETIYNALNLPETVIDGTRNATVYTYNAVGKVKSITDAQNNHQEFGYNTRGQNTSVCDATNHTSTAEYDVMGNLTKLAGPLGGCTDYTYDNMGRLSTESTVSGGSIQYTYQALQLKAQLTNARGQVRRFFYDAAGRITGYVGAEDSVSYTYDANGNILTVTDKVGTVAREYDARNLVTKYTDTYGNVIRYAYDEVGNLTQMVYPDQTTVHYTYDENNRLHTVTDWVGRVTTYTYDANGRVSNVVKADGSVTTNSYDNAQRIVSSVERTETGEIITGFSYTYDSLGRIIEENRVKILSVE